MSLKFGKLKSPILDLTDTISIGKLKGCRVCDVIPEFYDYLIWADKEGLLKFSAQVIESIKQHAGYRSQQEHYENEIAPYIDIEPDTLNFDDVPY